MAKTSAQKAKQRAISNMERRFNYRLNLIDREIQNTYSPSHSIQPRVDRYALRGRSTDFINSLRGKKLTRFILQHATVDVNNPHLRNLSYKDYVAYYKAYSKMLDTARKMDRKESVFLQQIEYYQSEEGFRQGLEALKRRGTKKWYIDMDNRMIANMMQSLNYASDSLGYEILTNLMSKMPKATLIQRIITGLRNGTIDRGVLFSSDQEVISTQWGSLIYAITGVRVPMTNLMDPIRELSDEELQPYLKYLE